MGQKCFELGGSLLKRLFAHAGGCRRPGGCRLSPLTGGKSTRIKLHQFYGRVEFLRSFCRKPSCPMESQTSVSKRVPREFRNWRVRGNPLPTLRQPFANPPPTLRQPFAHLFCQPLSNLFCQPLSNPLFPWTPGTRLETRVNGFLDADKTPRCRLSGVLNQWNPKYGCKGTVTTRFALIALVAWQY